jgi:hypothetical protein
MGMFIHYNWNHLPLVLEAFTNTKEKKSQLVDKRNLGNVNGNQLLFKRMYIYKLRQTPNY